MYIVYYILLWASERGQLWWLEGSDKESIDASMDSDASLSALAVWYTRRAQMCQSVNAFDFLK